MQTPDRSDRPDRPSDRPILTGPQKVCLIVWAIGMAFLFGLAAAVGRPVVLPLGVWWLGGWFVFEQLGNRAAPPRATA